MNRLFGLAALLVTFAGTAGAQTPQLYVEIDGITGDVVVQDYQGQIQAFDYRHLVERRDQALAHEAVVFSKKRIESSTPDIWNWYASGQRRDVTFHFYVTGGGGGTEIRTVRLINALVRVIEPISEEGDATGGVDRIRLDYQAIDVINPPENENVFVSNPGGVQ